MSDEIKRLKDPIYGYISVNSKILHEIVDTAAFQRLRQIRQTSYEPLYSAALHNRFIHSLGVYHLGCIASSAMKDNIGKSKYKNDWKKEWEDDFKLACLLHDVGHSPFSHSGEKFYDFDAIGEKVKKELGSSDFSKDFDKAVANSRKCKNHELMSACIGIKTFSDFIKDKEFFVRCIIGYTYELKGKDDKVSRSIKNALILLLNSPCIDVDKIDYLLRDSYVTGFDTIAIDYERLLKSVCFMMPNDDSEMSIVFQKRAISVLENVIYAHDAEQKWIQNHPVVKYETYIVQYIIDKVKKYYDNNEANIFSDAALTEKGVSSCIQIIDKESEARKDTVSLLCDDDIVFTMKNRLLQSDNNGLMREYFDRTKRRHPIWKSESEYRALFDNGGPCSNIKEKFQVQMQKLEKFLLDNDLYIITEETKNICEKCLENEIKKIDENENIGETDKSVQKIRLNDIQNALSVLKDTATNCNIPMDFVILKANRFESGFTTDSMRFLNVDFVYLEKPIKLEKINSTLKADKNEENKGFFYLFYRRTAEFNIDINNLIKSLNQAYSN